MKYKSGITITSLVIYVVLLFAFLSLTLSVSNNFSNGLYKDKGTSINYTNLDKIQYYLNKSSMNSNSATISSTSIAFSNGDEYTYNNANKTVYYNNGILCEDVTNFLIVTINPDLYEIQVGFNKYSENLQRDIRVYVGE